MATRKNKTPESGSVVKGTHLTVTTFADGTTKLEWDDRQLLKEVREAMATVEQPVPPKKTTRKKKETI